MLRSCATSFTYPLTRNPVLGRGFANILDPKLSRQHVRLEDATDGYSVIPLGRNGVGLGGGAVLKPGDEPGFLRLDEEISLLPGSDHRFVLAALPEADPAEPESKRQRSGEEDVAVQAASLSDGAATSSSGSAAGGSGGGGGGGASAGGGGGASDSDDDWTSVPLPPFAQPPKPSAPAGLDALARLAMQPESADARNIFLLTRELVVAYDLYPKGRVHLLILPRARRIDWPEKLAAEDAPLVRKCARLGRFLASRLRERTPELAPFVMGFHAVPSMRQLCAASSEGSNPIRLGTRLGGPCRRCGPTLTRSGCVCAPQALAPHLDRSGLGLAQEQEALELLCDAIPHPARRASRAARRPRRQARHARPRRGGGEPQRGDEVPGQRRGAAEHACRQGARRLGGVPAGRACAGARRGRGGALAGVVRSFCCGDASVTELTTTKACKLPELFTCISEMEMKFSSSP